jgi:hypothetical protein
MFSYLKYFRGYLINTSSCFSTNSSETGLKNNSLLQSFVIHLSLILQILGCQSFIGVESFPTCFATFTKKWLKIFVISD